MQFVNIVLEPSIFTRIDRLVICVFFLVERAIGLTGRHDSTTTEETRTILRMIMIIMIKTKLEDIASFEQLAPRQIERFVSDEFELCFSVDGS